MADFLLYALIAGVGVAIITGVLGCFVVWQRMAYFSDSLAHSTLLGIALGLQLGIHTTLATLLLCACFALLLLWAQQKQTLSGDSMLGVMAHAALAFGVLALSLSDNYNNIDLHSLLFGNILTVSQEDLFWLGGGGVFVFAMLIYFWQPLLLITINRDLAAAEGVAILRLQLLLILLMTITVAVSIQIIGLLLISALLIIPAATARLLARTPPMMAMIAACLGVTATLIGLRLSLTADLPAGPAIVSVMVLFFAATNGIHAAGSLRKK
ncbi:MAG: metal ABC transporter permease [Proteobacteria bacterium]|nr:metal ABC transporter permease [Pseudomonadota bacterium]MCH9758192.1 metal ABC transporter permease [Pseudomonadota bacterium]